MTGIEDFPELFGFAILDDGELICDIEEEGEIVFNILLDKESIDDELMGDK